ncbi:acetyl-CoA C-acyltransferase [Bacillus sp. FJAT-50079]|uniref:acetyl-CoA C-acyltransferase n=1 Tax=Bacillus sp. FJAT-50079 TaxID=2833577 RepID=UPI001BC94107|nr:acetyl-CoA C-acyltransferase [Bacillus sp. FJAT-50079]MBS4209387.1 acetyl-CoA C-acyltransferase [Bacillus sp. FJAT-50079]
MRKAVLLDGVRTPIGRFKGIFQSKSAVELGEIAVSELIRRYPEVANADGAILAQVIQAGQGQNPTRQVAVQAGIDLSTPAITLNNVCLASLATVADAARRIERNEGDLFVVGGFESMTNAPHISNLRAGVKLGSVELQDTLNDGLWCALSDQSMGGISEKANRELQIQRQEQDEYAEQSQVRAAKAQAEGIFKEEIVSVKVADQLITEDECIRPQTTLEKLQNLRPAFEANGTITAGNASQMSDGASAGIITNLETCEKIGKKPLATIIDWSFVAGPDPTLHLQPANAIQSLLDRTQLKLSDIDLFEINEAFAGVVIASQRKLGLPSDIVNVNGGAIAIGHPLGASGFRTLLTLAKELKRRGGGRGIATLCGGGGQGAAVLIEVE